jgi:hypothetical protein
MIIGKQHSTRRHGVFGVVDHHGLLVCGNARHEMSVGRRGRIGINHGQEIVPFAIRIAGPGKQVMSRAGWFLIGGLRAHKTHAQNEGKTEYETGHLISHHRSRSGFASAKDISFAQGNKKGRLEAGPLTKKNLQWPPKV